MAKRKRTVATKEEQAAYAKRIRVDHIKVDKYQAKLHTNGVQVRSKNKKIQFIEREDGSWQINFIRMRKEADTDPPVTATTKLVKGKVVVTSIDVSKKSFYRMVLALGMVQRDRQWYFPAWMQFGSMDEEEDE